MSPRLSEKFRGRGYGKKLVETARAKGARIRTKFGCEVEELYVKRGFLAVERDAWDENVVLRPATDEETL